MRGDPTRNRFYFGGLAALLLSGAALAQDPEELLQRLKAHMSEHLAQMSKYTCHETIDRMTRTSGTWRHRDTLEFEVAIAGDKELFLKPGTDHFEEQPIEQIAQGGTMSNRVMGSDVDLIFSRNMADFKFAGTCKKDGHKTYRFNLKVPIENSRYAVHRAGRAVIAGYEGSVWVDAETLDLVRVDFKINQIPSSIGVSLVEESLHYKRLTIGNSDFDLPDHSELSVMDGNGNYSLNMIKLNRCREFGSDSVVKYGSQVESSADRRDHQ